MLRCESFFAKSKAKASAVFYYYVPTCLQYDLEEMFGIRIFDWRFLISLEFVEKNASHCYDLQNSFVISSFLDQKSRKNRNLLEDNPIETTWTVNILSIERFPRIFWFCRILMNFISQWLDLLSVVRWRLGKTCKNIQISDLSMEFVAIMENIAIKPRVHLCGIAKGDISSRINAIKS